METPVSVASWSVVVAARPAKPCNWKFRRGSKMWRGSEGKMNPIGFSKACRFLERYFGDCSTERSAILVGLAVATFGKRWNGSALCLQLASRGGPHESPQQ